MQLRAPAHPAGPPRSEQPRPTAPDRTRATSSGRLARLLLDHRRGGEVRATAERAVEARPALTAGQLLLQAVEGAQAAAEVVAEVHERRLARARDDRAAVLQRAVV